MIPISVIEDDEQHAMHYSQSLPYAELLDGEAEQWLNSICTHLVICVKAKDYAPGASTWVRRLSNYMDMKHAVPRETRANLAKLLYELTVMPGMDLALVELWASNCIRLIRHKKRLGPEDLELDWKPLYKLIDKTLFPKSRQPTLISESKIIISVHRLAEYVQRFFSPNAVTEILQEFLPKFTIHSVADAIRVGSYLSLFLPIDEKQHFTTSPDEYLPTLFSLWSMFTGSATVDSMFTALMSRVAEANIAKKDGLFTQSQVKTVFTAGLRMMNLPVGSRSDGGGSGAGASGGTTTGYGSHGVRNDMKAGSALMLLKKSDKCRSLARFIIYTIMPDSNGNSYSLTQLSDLIQAIELYYHPSNHGSWSYLLTTFARHLATEFLKRWREEQEEDCNTPKEFRLTEKLRKEFVLILRPVTYLSMFGKDQYTVGASQSTLKHLAWLEPSLIFPGLLERIYPSLETLTETHRTSSALSILADISLPLFSRDHYPAGGKHLLPLLHLAIPGIDMNDPIKTISSLVFISTSLMSIPIVDMTQQPAQDDYYPTEMTEDPFAELSKESEDYLVRATTGEFEEWLAKFMRRVFTIFDNLPQENHKKQGGSSSSSSNNTMESGLTQMLLHTCDLIFGQLSDELYDMVLRLVVDFVSDRVLPNAVRAVGLLCDAITSVHPKKAAQVFIPLCISQIESELEHGACSTRSHSAASNLIQSDSTFHWYQNILFSVVSTLGPEVLVYKSELIAVTHTMVTHCYSRRGMMWTGKLIRNILKTVLDIYPKDFKSLNASQWKDKDFMNTQSHKIWGQPGDPANLEIQWHVPSEEEKNFALEFLDEFLTPSVTRLEEIMNSQPDQLMMESYALSNELCRRLAVIRNCLMGSSTMVADDGVEELPEDRERCAGDEDANVLEPTQKLQVGYTFTDTTDPRMAKARNVRKMIGELVHKLAIYFKTKREDDVESVKILIKIIRAYLSERGVERAQFDRSKSGYSYAKNIGKTPLCKKRYPRNLLVRRAYNHHLLRLRQNVQGRVRTPLHDDLITDLLDMSLGFYAEIRKQSQSALTATGRCFLGSKSIILPTLLKALSPSEDGTSDRMKGALYLFTHKSILLPCIRDWRFIPTFVETICGAQHQDKITIQELIRKVFRDYIHYFNAYSFHLIIPENLDALLTAVSPETIQKSDFESKVQTIESKVESRLHRQIESYHGLIEFLLDFMENSRVHWRFAFMAANFIQIFMRSNILKPSKKLATFVTKATLSEIPAMRRIGMSTTSQLLLYIKQRTFAKNDVDVLTRGEARNPLRMDVSVDSNNDQLGRELLEQSTQKLTPENAATSLLVDDPITGWYVWPEQYAAYKVNTSDNFIFSDIDQESLGAFDEFKEKFNSSDYWSKLCTYLSEEISQKQEDQFSSTFARLFNSIFQTYGDEPLATAKEHIERLAYASDQKNHQRAAAEILGGLIRGTKHWPIAKAAATWDWLIPLLRKVFVSITPDSLTYWESFVRFCSARRDPRRIQPLIDLVLEAELDPTSDAAFNESRKLLLSRTLVVKLQWRFNPWIEKILPSYLGNIQHPYKQVREVIGGNIDELVQIEWIPSVTSVQNLLKANASTDGVGNVPTQPTIPAQKERIEYIRKQLEMWFKEQSNTVVTGGISDYSHGSKTVLCWLHESLTRWRLPGTLPYIIPLLPNLFTMLEINDDQDLQVMVTRVLNLIAQLSYPPDMVPTLVEQFLTILTTSSSWHIRIRALPLLQIFFFKHLFIMTGSQLLQIMQVVGRMLLDSQIEVRQLASVTLGGLVRCSQRDAIQSLLKEFSEKVKIKIPRRKRDKTTGKNIEPEGFAEAVLQKHSGVLGLSCLVNAFPYEVPEWMPIVLCDLADCISEPAAEIQATIRKTFSDFRRTHSDTWHEDMKKFSEDQLSVLSDMLISPSYYA